MKRTTCFIIVLVANVLVLWVVPALRAADPEPQTVRVAAISFVPQKFDLAGNVDRLERAFRDARKQGAQLAVGPEGVLEGYVVNESIRGDVPAERMREVAIAIDDPVIKRFERLARELEMCLVFGFAEKVGDDVFNCAIFIDQQGRIRDKYHKMQLAEGYHSAWWFNRLGTQCRTFDTPFGRCGMMICNDRWNAQLARIAALDGAQFLLIPSFGSSSPSQDEAVLNRGRENGVPVVEANVGVTLIVDEGKIAAVDRRQEGIILGTITIPSKRDAKPEERDQLEREFLEWRKAEMQTRHAATLERLQKNATTSEKNILAQVTTVPAKPTVKPLVVDLWPGKTPGDIGIEGEETTRIYQSPILGGPTLLVTNVTKPTLTIYRPAQNNNGTAMLILPGGGYHNLFWELEGEEVAAWLNSVGMTGIIVKYRCPRRPGEAKAEPPLGPLLDTQRAVSLVRSRAKEWGINPQRIGMVGFSAGGHLALATATRFEKRTYEPIDSVDEASCRPDFAVMCYSGYLKAFDRDELWPGITIPVNTPPIFMAHSSDDRSSHGGSHPENSVIMYLALKRAGIPAELHVYSSGEHDFGVRQNDKLPSSWPNLCVRWLRSHQLLSSAPGDSPR